LEILLNRNQNARKRESKQQQKKIVEKQNWSSNLTSLQNFFIRLGNKNTWTSLNSALATECILHHQVLDAAGSFITAKKPEKSQRMNDCAIKKRKKFLQTN
jgi:hypothetical protein